MLNGSSHSAELTPATQDEINALQEAANPFYFGAHLLAERGVPTSLINSASLLVTAQLLARDTSPEFATDQLINMAHKILLEVPGTAQGHA